MRPSFVAYRQETPPLLFACPGEKGMAPAQLPYSVAHSPSTCRDTFAISISGVTRDWKSRREGGFLSSHNKYADPSFCPVKSFESRWQGLIYPRVPSRPSHMEHGRLLPAAWTRRGSRATTARPVATGKSRPDAGNATRSLPPATTSSLLRHDHRRSSLSNYAATEDCNRSLDVGQLEGD